MKIKHIETKSTMPLEMHNTRAKTRQPSTHTNDCTGGEYDQIQIRKNLEIEKVNVQGQHPCPAECAAAIE